MSGGASHERPFVTIVVTGRNDDFGGDFNARFFRALRFNHERLTEAQIPHEFAFVEWCPQPGKPLLATVLVDEFPSLAVSQLVCYVVDPTYHEVLTLDPRLPFHEFLAKNVAIRRAAGRFVLTTNTDVYLSRGIIDRLASASLKRGVLYRAACCALKSHTDLSLLDWDVLEDSRNCEVINHVRPPYFDNACGDFLLLDRDTYHRLRGFNEVYRAAGIHIDSNFCVKAHSSGVALVDIGFPVYRVGRGALKTHKTAYKRDPLDASWGQRWNSVIYINRPEWGLARAPERHVDVCTTYLEFDWRAIGPMIELKRLVLPAARKGTTC